jgi:hypothetical protein
MYSINLHMFIEITDFHRPFTLEMAKLQLLDQVDLQTVFDSLCQGFSQ